MNEHPSIVSANLTEYPCCEGTFTSYYAHSVLFMFVLVLRGATTLTHSALLGPSFDQPARTRAM